MKPASDDGQAAAREQPRPVLRIVRGDATAEEIAALVAVLSAGAASADPPPAPEPSPWGSPRLSHARPLPIGPDSWRLSGFDTANRTRAGW